MYQRLGLLSYEGVKYSIFEIESAKKNYRFDIVEEGANFQIDSDKIVASKYYNKIVYTYGNTKMLTDVLKVIREVREDSSPLETKNTHLGGMFVQEFKKTNTPKNLIWTCKKVNGKIEEELCQLGNTAIFFKEADFGGLENLKPANYKEYQIDSMLEIKEKEESAEYYSAPMLENRMDLSHLRGKDYKFTTDLDEVSEIDMNEGSLELLWGMDTETNGLEVDIEGDKSLSTIILSYEKNKTRLLATRADKIPTISLEEAYSLFEKLKKLQDDWVKLKGFLSGFVAHNKKFDNKVVMKTYQKYYEKHGYIEDGVNPFNPEQKLYRPITDCFMPKHCSFNLAAVETSDIFLGPRGLKYLSQKYTGNEYPELEDVFKTKEGITKFHVLDEKTACIYGGPDGENPRIVFTHKIQELPRDSLPIYKLETELADLKSEQEFYGIRLNEKKVYEDYKKAYAEREFLETIIFKMLGQKINLNSPDAMRVLLYQKMKCPILKYAKGGNDPSTDKQVLDTLAKIQLGTPRDTFRSDIISPSGKKIISKDDLNKRKYPILIIILKFREVDKLISGFYEGVISLKEEK